MGAPGCRTSSRSSGPRSSSGPERRPGRRTTASASGCSATRCSSPGPRSRSGYFLPRILSGEHVWCQGYSEPDAGSDLAGVRTRAVLDGEEWVINGQKIWTSAGATANWIFVIARTDPGVPKHKGLTFLLVPIDQPGVEVRTIKNAACDDCSARSSSPTPGRRPGTSSAASQRVVHRDDPARLRARRRGDDRPDPVPARPGPAARARARARPGHRAGHPRRAGLVLRPGSRSCATGATGA